MIHSLQFFSQRAKSWPFFGMDTPTPCHQLVSFVDFFLLRLVPSLGQRTSQPVVGIVILSVLVFQLALIEQR